MKTQTTIYVNCIKYLVRPTLLLALAFELEMWVSEKKGGEMCLSGLYR